MPVSQRRLAANRVNAQKSTGPRSAAGKSISSRNAVTHGLRCAPAGTVSPVLPGEDEQQYRTLRDQLASELHSLGAMQREIVEQLAQTIWRLRRIPGIEQAVMERAFKSEMITRDLRRKCHDRTLDPDAPPPSVHELLAEQFEA